MTQGKHTSYTELHAMAFLPKEEKDKAYLLLLALTQQKMALLVSQLFSDYAAVRQSAEA